jgi:uncharacterized protein YceH (UPF0502 family)
VPLVLTPVEARVLGALIEKEITTPDYYPLSLNALVNACNQKSNRDPHMDLDDATVENSLRTLAEKNLAGRADNMDSRVTKYEHRLQEAFNFTRLETAILCELLLRGAQTPGELRSRAERMHHFDDLNEVLSTLRRLMEHDPPLAAILPRQPGTKEQRYTHLFSGEVQPSHPEPPPTPSAPAVTPSALTSSERLIQLEKEVSTLKSEIASLKQQLANFQKQFD